MLEVLNKRKRNLDMDNIKRINHFWEKELCKNQKKIFKWLARFSYNDVIAVAPTFDYRGYIDYNDYLAFVNNANNLLFVKSKKMNENLKVINKLRKMLGDYGIMNAFYTFMLIINDFFEKDKSDESFDKRKYWITSYNDYIDQMWDRYKKEYLACYADEPTLKQKAAEAFDYEKQSDDELFFPKQTIELLLTFMRKTIKSKKVTEKQFNTIYLNALFFYYYMYALYKMIKRTLLNYPDPKKEAKALKWEEKHNKKDSQK